MNLSEQSRPTLDRCFSVLCFGLFGALLWLTPGRQAIAHEYFTGNFTFVHPWADATAADATEATVYFVLENIVRDDKLLRAYTNLADEVELRKNNDSTVPSLNSIDIPAQDKMEFLPGRFHVRLKGLRAPLQWGRSYVMTFVFEHAGQITVMVSIGAH